MDENNTLTKISGLMVGQVTDEVNRTGCTAVLCPEGAVCGVHVPGFAPGSHETELLNPLARVEEVHGILLAGGSAFGLAAVTGVVQWLSEHGYGLQTLHAKVPLVPGAIIYDLFFNKSLGKPDAAMGYEAAQKASTEPVVQGCVGAGTGATAGKLAGITRAMKTGLGSVCLSEAGIKVGALAVVNPVGDVVDPDTGEILAGVRTPDGKGFSGALNTLGEITNLLSQRRELSNTVLGVVATEASLNKVQAARVARMASAGIARAVRPAHLLYDGDTVFALSTGREPGVDENVVGALAAEALAQAIAAGARQASSVPGLPAWKDMPQR